MCKISKNLFYIIHHKNIIRCNNTLTLRQTVARLKKTFLKTSATNWHMLRFSLFQNIKTEILWTLKIKIRKSNWIC